MLAVGTNGRTEWINYSTSGEFLCPVSEANSLLHGELLVASAKKVYRMLSPFLQHSEDFGTVEDRFECNQAPDVSRVPEVFHRVIFKMVNRQSHGKIIIDRSRGSGDCSNKVVILMILVHTLLFDEADEARIVRDVSTMIANSVTDYFESDNLRKLSTALDVEELNLKKIYVNQINMRSFWTTFSRAIDNRTEGMGDEIEYLNTAQEDINQENNIKEFVNQVKASGILYFAHMSSGSFYNTNMVKYIEDSLMGGAITLYGDTKCKYYNAKLLCHLSLPDYQYLKKEQILRVTLYAETIDFSQEKIFKCVPKFPHGMTSIRNHRVIINADQFFNVIQTDDSRIYRLNETDSEIFEKQHLVSSPWRCYFNGDSSKFVVSCESETTVATQGGRKIVLPQFQALPLVKQDFPLTINGMTLPLSRVVTQIQHSDALNVASDMYTSISTTPSRFHQLLQNFEFEEEGDPINFDLFWKHPDGKSYVTITSVIMGVFALIGLVWSCAKCYPRCAKFCSKPWGYVPALGNGNSPDSDEEVELENMGQVRVASAPPADERNVSFRDQATSVFPRGTRVRQ